MRRLAEIETLWHRFNDHHQWLPGTVRLSESEYMLVNVDDDGLEISPAAVEHLTDDELAFAFAYSSYVDVDAMFADLGPLLDDDISAVSMMFQSAKLLAIEMLRGGFNRVHEAERGPLGFDPRSGADYFIRIEQHAYDQHGSGKTTDLSDNSRAQYVVELVEGT